MSNTHIIMLNGESAYSDLIFIKRILEFYARIGIGQFEEIGYECVINWGGTKINTVIDGTVSPNDAIATFKNLLGHPINGSYGIGNPDVSDDAKRAWEIYKVLARAGWEYRRAFMPNAYIEYTVDKDGLSLRYLNDTAPLARLFMSEVLINDELILDCIEITLNDEQLEVLKKASKAWKDLVFDCNFMVLDEMIKSGFIKPAKRAEYFDANTVTLLLKRLTHKVGEIIYVDDDKINHIKDLNELTFNRIENIISKSVKIENNHPAV